MLKVAIVSVVGGLVAEGVCKYKCDGVVQFNEWPEINARQYIDNNELVTTAATAEPGFVKFVGASQSALDAARVCCVDYKDASILTTNKFMIRNYIGLTYPDNVNITGQYEFGCFPSTLSGIAAEPINWDKLKNDTSGVAVGYVGENSCDSGSMELHRPDGMNSTNPRSIKEVTYYCDQIVGLTAGGVAIESTIFQKNETFWMDSNMLAGMVGNSYTEEGHIPCSAGVTTPLAYRKKPILFQMPTYPVGGFFETAAISRVADVASRCCSTGKSFAVRSEPGYNYPLELPLYRAESFCYNTETPRLIQVPSNVEQMNCLDGLPCGVVNSETYKTQAASVYHYYNCSDILFRQEFGWNLTIPYDAYILAGSGTRTVMALGLMFLISFIL